MLYYCTELDANQMKDFGILNHRIPKHSKYMTEESRVASFETWPVSEIKTPQELANAGFYYTGIFSNIFRIYLLVQLIEQIFLK